MRAGVLRGGIKIVGRINSRIKGSKIRNKNDFRNKKILDVMNPGLDSDPTSLCFSNQPNIQLRIY